MQFVAFIAIYPILWLISILPFRLLYLCSDVLYLILYYIIGYRKNTVTSNLRLVFPEKSSKEIIIITKKFYQHLCDMTLETIKSMSMSEAEMKARFTFSNIEVIKDFEAQHKSIILMCGHYASWEWIFILQRYTKHKGFAIYKRISNKHFDRLIKKIRARYNSYLITTKEAIPTLIKAKNDGQLTMNGFASDQSPKKGKAYHWNSFMGINVPVHTGAEMMSKRLDMPVVFFGVKRLKRGYYQTTFTTLAESPKSYKDYEITDAFLKLVEDQIYAAPEYYLWTHKRWKHRQS